MGHEQPAVVFFKIHEGEGNSDEGKNMRGRDGI
jgi:hypothetical protein